MTLDSGSTHGEWHGEDRGGHGKAKRGAREVKRLARKVNWNATEKAGEEGGERPERDEGEKRSGGVVFSLATDDAKEKKGGAS